jgi:hypothetical protein
MEQFIKVQLPDDFFGGKAYLLFADRAGDIINVLPFHAAGDNGFLDMLYLFFAKLRQAVGGSFGNGFKRHTDSIGEFKEVQNRFVFKAGGAAVWRTGGADTPAQIPAVRLCGMSGSLARGQARACLNAARADR